MLLEMDCEFAFAKARKKKIKNTTTWPWFLTNTFIVSGLSSSIIQKLDAFCKNSLNDRELAIT